jgi:hypothetical protein
LLSRADRSWANDTSLRTAITQRDDELIHRADDLNKREQHRTIRDQDLRTVMNKNVTLRDEPLAKATAKSPMGLPAATVGSL